MTRPLQLSTDHRQPLSKADDAADGTSLPHDVPSALPDAGSPRVSAGPAPSPGSPGPADPLHVAISDDIALILRLCAEHVGVPQAEVVRRSIVHFGATRVGLPGLADALGRAPATSFNEAGELTDVPSFARSPDNRFAERPLPP